MRPLRPPPLHSFRFPRHSLRRLASNTTTASTAPPPPPPPPPPRRFLTPYTLRLLSILSWLPAGIFISNHVISLHTISGASMSPTFPASRTLALCWKWGIHRKIQRGDIIALRKPIDPEQVVVKRVVALEGDLIRIRPGGWETSKRNWRNRDRMFWKEGEIVRVPAGCVWVEGDNREFSEDSNGYGAVPLGCVEGKYWVTVRGEVKHGEEFCRQDAVVRKGPFDMPPVKRRVEGSWDLW